MSFVVVAADDVMVVSAAVLAVVGVTVVATLAVDLLVFVSGVVSRFMISVVFVIAAVAGIMQDASTS